jgi:hypothetical protein
VPYEVFVLKDGFKEFKALDGGTVRKATKGLYQLIHEDGKTLVCPNLTEFCSDEEEALARMVSISLRHGVELEHIVRQLEKVNGSLVIFAKVIARTLKKYIADGTKVVGEICSKCGSADLERQGGCVTCKSCASSTCS